MNRRHDEHLDERIAVDVLSAERVRLCPSFALPLLDRHGHRRNRSPMAVPPGPVADAAERSASHVAWRDRVEEHRRQESGA